VFKGRYVTCWACRVREQACPTCGRDYQAPGGGPCPSCVRTERQCLACGETFKGTALKCARCRAIERTCTECGDSYIGNGTKCWRCYAGEKPCAGCGRLIRTGSSLCSGCRTTDRQCITCDRTFRGRTLECKKCSGQGLADAHARRALKIAAQVAGPVPARVYREVISSGPCVYCGKPATTADHVRPLSRGGHEAEYNLVPACGPCNFGKGGRLLSEWDQVRVAHGAAHSPVVAAELERELADAAGGCSAALSPS
jgi:hypothetical protein